MIRLRELRPRPIDYLVRNYELDNTADPIEVDAYTIIEGILHA